MKSLYPTILSAAFALTTFATAEAASVNLISREASVGLNYTIGFASTVNQGARSDADPSSAAVLVADSVSGVRPLTDEPQGVAVFAEAFGALAVDNAPSVVDPTISGAWSASITFPTFFGTVAAGAASALASENQFNLAFEVLDDPVDILLSFSTDRPASIIRIFNDAGLPVASAGALNTAPVSRTLAPGLYTLNTFFALSATASGGGASGSGSFELTFQNAGLTAAPVPLPAGALFLGTALVGFAGLRKRGGARTRSTVS